MRTLLLFLLLSIKGFAQDTINIHHKAYSITFSKSKHYPVRVEWWVTKNGLTCETKIKRGDKIFITGSDSINKDSSIIEILSDISFSIKGQGILSLTECVHE